MRLQITFLAIAAVMSSIALADDQQLPVVDGTLDVVPDKEQTVKALTQATFEDERVQKHMVTQVTGPAERAYRELRRQGIDFRVSVPEGVGVAFSYSPAAPLTTAISVNTMLGGTVSVSAEATFNTMWWYDPFWKKGFTPVVTVKFSHIRFTGLVDDIANEQIQKIYGDQFTVKMAGRYVNMGSAMGGFDYVASGGLHLMLRGGIVAQLGESGGGDNSMGNIKLKGWWGPAAELGIGGTFSWF